MITLKTLGKTFDITNHVDQSQNMVKNTLDGTLNTGKIVLSAMYFDELGDGIDLERRIPVYSIVEIEALDKTHQFYVKSDDVVKHNDKCATHTIELEELKSLLGERPIPDMSVTQPTGQTSYVSEISRAVGQVLQMNTNNKQEISLILNGLSSDVFYIDNRVLKQARTYTINASITLARSELGANNMGQLTIEVGGQVATSISFNLTDIKLMQPNVFNLSTNFTTTQPNQEVKFYFTGFEVTSIYVNSGSLTIRTQVGTANPIYLDSVVEKVLRLHNLSNQNEYVLDPSSKARLSTILAYDTMETQQTQLSLLEKIASYIKARLSVYIRNNQKYVEFQFYDEMEQAEYKEVHRDTQVARTENTNHYSGLSVEANNVISSGLKIESYKTLRAVSDTTDLITTDNITIMTSQPIDRIAYITIQGVAIYLSNGNIFRDNTFAHRISNRVVEKPYYDTLNKMSDYSREGRLGYSQNNHIYYVRGDNKLYGLSSIGTMGVTWTANVGNRALYETIYATYQDNNPDGLFREKHDTGQNLDDNLLITIAYYPMATTNALVLKSDQSGFEEKAITRLNSSSRVNQIDFLGSYAKGRIDSMGGTEISFYGDTKTVDGLPVVGTVDSQGYRLITLTQQVNPIATSFVATIVKDHVFQSNYIGVDSDRRLYEIPKDEYVLRVDKNYNITNLSLSPLNSNETMFSLNTFFLHLIGTVGTPPNFALLRFDDREITTEITTLALGSTIELNWRMKDNYSAGQRRYVNDGKTYQVGVPYCDISGNVTTVNSRLYMGAYATLDLSKNYPQGHIYEGVLVGETTHNVYKDSRECLALSSQLIFQSLDPNVLIYNGMAKFNKIVTSDRTTKLAVLHYKPTLDDKVIDLGRATIQDLTATLGDNVVNVTLATNGVGFAWYDELTKELILAVIKDVTPGLHKVYFNGEKYQ